MKKSIVLYPLALFMMLLASSACGNSQEQALHASYKLVYSQSPTKVQNLGDMLQEGTVYGRVRSNSFLYLFEKENSSQKSHATSGLGGSLIYQSASYQAFDFRAGFYYTHGFVSESQENVSKLKSGQDVLNKHSYANNGSQDMGVLGQAYLNYRAIPKTNIRAGRQLVETFYTKSNDSKMIPNVFDAIVLQTKAVPNTNLKLAYLQRQKLRGHTEPHAVLLYGDANASATCNPEFTQNDDSAMHEGLTYTRLQAHHTSTDAPLFVGDIHNKSFENLLLESSFYSVKELVSQIMTEANYKMQIGAFSFTPGARYIKQFDNGAGKIGGAALSGKLIDKSGESGGYKEANSLTSQMLAARLVGVYGIYSLNLAYSEVFDESDLVTPWRGFATNGYTRSMGRTNWIANTKSYRAQLSVNRNKSGVYKDIYMQFSFLHTDADEKKEQFDENYYYAGFIQNLSFMQELQWRFRVGYQDTKKEDADTVDTRFELNYLF